MIIVKTNADCINMKDKVYILSALTTPGTAEAGPPQQPQQQEPSRQIVGRGSLAKAGAISPPQGSLFCLVRDGAVLLLFFLPSFSLLQSSLAKYRPRRPEISRQGAIVSLKHEKVQKNVNSRSHEREGATTYGGVRQPWWRSRPNI